MKNFKLKVILAAVFAVAVTVVVTIFWAERDFRSEADTQLSHAAQIKTLEFQSSLNEQLTLVRQMVRSPLVKNYLKNPDDPDASRMGKLELLSFQDAFLSKSIFWVSDADHKFWSDMQYAYDLDPEDPDTYWYKMTMYETQEYNFNINYNPDLNKTMLWVNAVVRNESGSPIGIAGTGIPLTDFINSMYEGIPKEVEMYLYNDSLEITGATDQSILKDHIPVTKRLPDMAKFDAFPSDIATRSAPKAEYVIGPLKLIGWYMVLKSDYTPLAFLSSAVTPIAICLVAVILIFVFFYTSNVAISAKTLKVAVDELSSGNADLTQRVKLKSDSALKVMNELVASLNRFIEKLQGIVGSVKNSNEALVNTGTALRDCTQNTVASINEIIGNIESMGAGLESQSKSVDQTAGAVTEISSNIESMGKMIENQTQSVSQASSAVEEMIGNINSVNASVEKLSGSFAILQKGATEGVAKQEEVNKMVLDVQQQSEMLKTANSVISGIARQTNLLAMNAAIEAAHAGEAGKGFSVVADEIRKLSENSSAQTKTIGAQLKTIQESVDQIVSASKSSQDALKAVSDSIAETDALVHEISGAMGEQLEGSAQINEALSVLNNNSSQVKQSSEEMTQGNQAILREVEMLESATGDIKSGMDEMRTGASLISNVSDQLKNLAGEMQNAIDSIGQELGQFRV
ncbi:MAG: methyl-accepting chemotaxis protein [Treponema sp.]|nr:methyl-accepting chemotaxis protein [Treponema sp.]